MVIPLASTPLISDANLKLYLPLNGNFTDSSPSGYNLTPGGTPSDQTGVFSDSNGAKGFASASSQYAKIAHASAPNLNILGSQTWWAWVYPTAFTNNGRIMSKADATNTANRKEFYLASTGKLEIDMRGLSSTFIASDAALSLNTWQFVAMIWDASAGILKQWVGSTKKQITGVTGTPASSTSAFRMGAAGFGGGDTESDFADMRIDESAVFDRALSDAEVAQYRDGTWSSILKIGGVTYAATKKVGGIAIASVKKISGLA